MKLKLMLGISVLAVLALSASSASAGTGDKATGGGQTIIGDSGKGSTIAFTAQQSGDAGTPVAKGQVQWIDRSAGSGKSAVKFHGVVDCIEVDGNFAIIGGFNKKDSEDRFTLRVVDNGEPNQGQDLIEFTDTDDTEFQCGDGEEDDPPAADMTLARGNAQVRNGDPNNPPVEEEQSTSALSLLAF